MARTIRPILSNHVIDPQGTKAITDTPGEAVSLDLAMGLKTHLETHAKKKGDPCAGWLHFCLQSQRTIYSYA